MTWKSPTKPWAECTAKRQEALYEAWSTGVLDWKLDPTQKEVVAEAYASHARAKSSLERMYVFDFTRRGGKDFCMATMAVQEAFRHRRRIRIPYAAPTREVCHDILIPIFEEIFKDCPPELLPYELRRGTFKTNSPELNFDWGPQIALIGVDLHPERLRGTDTYAFFFTEPAFVEGLEHLMKSILLPQLLTNPEGFGVLGSTPPVTPGHYWSSKVVPDAKLRGMYSMRTVYQFPERIGPAQIQGAIEMCGGDKTTQFRREYLCEHVTESTLAYVPEFKDVKEYIVTDEPFLRLPAYRDTYVAMDPGFAHATGCIFGYEDFENATINIEGCFKTQGLNSAEVAQRVKAREWQLWGRVPVKPSKYTDAAWAEELALIRSHFYPGLNVPSSPVVAWNSGHMNAKTYRRVSDTDSRLIADLNQEHGLLFFPTEKENVEAHRNAMCLNIQRLRYRIHPRCVELITDLEQAVWNKPRTKLAEQAGGGHFDTVKALEYLNRNVTWGRNPFPPNEYDRFNFHVPTKAEAKTTGAISRAFGAIRGRRRR